MSNLNHIKIASKDLIEETKKVIKNIMEVIRDEER